MSLSIASAIRHYESEKRRIKRWHDLHRRKRLCSECSDNVCRVQYVQDSVVMRETDLSRCWKHHESSHRKKNPNWGSGRKNGKPYKRRSKCSTHVKGM